MCPHGRVALRRTDCGRCDGDGRHRNQRDRDDVSDEAASETCHRRPPRGPLLDHWWLELITTIPRRRRPSRHSVSFSMQSRPRASLMTPNGQSRNTGRGKRRVTCLARRPSKPTLAKANDDDSSKPTVVGNIVNDPIRRTVGDQVALKFRVASNSRRPTATASGAPRWRCAPARWAPTCPAALRASRRRSLPARTPRPARHRNPDRRPMQAVSMVRTAPTAPMPHPKQRRG
jgi:hypothetical protein